MHLFTIKSKTM